MQETYQKMKKQAFHLSNFKCPQNKTAFCVCISKTCQQPGIMCRNQSCKCDQKHTQCNFTKLQLILNKIEENRQKLPTQTKKSFQTILKCYEDLIQIISLKKVEVEQQMQFYGLRKSQIQFLKIFQANQMNIKFKGSFISQVRQDQIQINSLNAIRSFKDSQQIQKIFEYNHKKINSLLKDIDQFITLKNIKKGVILGNKKPCFQVNDIKNTLNQENQIRDNYKSQDQDFDQQEERLRRYMISNSNSSNSSSLGSNPF